eukprot:1391551-Amorphochlora_amoeboformis.AAC.2
MPPNCTSCIHPCTCTVFVHVPHSHSNPTENLERLWSNFTIITPCDHAKASKHSGSTIAVQRGHRLLQTSIKG